MILGQRFAKIHLEVIQTLPSGLTIYRRKLLPAVPGQVACIGGPIKALDSLASNFQAQSVLNQLKNMCSNISSYIPKLDFFQSTHSEDVDVSIPGVGKLTAEVKTLEAEEQGTKGNNKAKSGN